MKRRTKNDGVCSTPRNYNYVPRKCERCGKTYKPTSKNQRFCSYTCSETRMHQCNCCKKEFHGRSRRVMFCSKECSSKYAKETLGLVGYRGPTAIEIERVCPICGEPFLATHGRHKFCSAECRGAAKYLGKGASGSTESQYARISGNLRRYLSRLASTRRIFTRGLSREETGCDRDYLLSLYEAQGGRCALSGVPLTTILEKGKKFPTNLSIDRIVPEKGYVPGNVQLICTVLNGFRNSMPVAEYIEWCRLVAKYQETQTK